MNPLVTRLLGAAAAAAALAAASPAAAATISRAAPAVEVAFDGPLGAIDASSAKLIDIRHHGRGHGVHAPRYGYRPYGYSAYGRDAYGYSAYGYASPYDRGFDAGRFGAHPHRSLQHGFRGSRAHGLHDRHGRKVIIRKHH